jgi:DNA processing protein
MLVAYGCPTRTSTTSWAHELAATASEARAVLLLARACLPTKGVALWQVSAAVQRVGSARTVLEGEFEPATEWELAVPSAARRMAAELPDAEAPLEVELGEWGERGLGLTTVLADDYPLNLRWVYDRPPFLFYRGELKQLEDAYALATEAHRTALEVGGRTVAVLGHGFDHLYPKENAALAETIAERGAVVSLFFPPTPPTPRTCLMRNVVTSGMGQGTIVVEASKTSGARLQARLAIEHGSTPSSSRACWTTTSGPGTSPLRGSRRIRGRRGPALPPRLRRACSQLGRPRARHHRREC